MVDIVSNPSTLNGQRATFTGFDEIRANIQKFGYGIANNAIVAAARASASVVVKQARANAMAHGFKKSGLMIRNIRAIRRRSGVPEGQVIFSVGILANKKNGANNPYYWRFLEFGWNHVGSASRLGKADKKAGKTRAVTSIPARPFIQPAGEQSVDAAINAFKIKITEYLAKKTPVNE